MAARAQPDSKRLPLKQSSAAKEYDRPSESALALTTLGAVSGNKAEKQTASPYPVETR